MHIYISILILLFFNSIYAAHSSPTKGSVALLPSVAPALRKNVNNLESEARPMSPTKVMIVKSSASKSTTNNVEDAVSSAIDSNTEDEEDGDEAVSANQIDIINKNNNNNNNNIDKDQDQDQESQDNNARSTNNILGTAVSPNNGVDVPIAQPPLSDIIADAHVPISKTADATNTDEATTATTTTAATTTTTTPTSPTTSTTPTSPTTAEKVSVVAATTADPPLPTSVSTTPTNNAVVATPRTELSTYIPSLNSELQFIDFAPLSLTASKEYLGIGHSMQARFVWTPTLWDLTNSTGGVMGSGPREGTVQNQYMLRM